MVILIAGASHTGKTLLAQQLMERLHYPVLSLDLLKMGLIRSGQTTLTPEDDAELTPYLWGIVREIIKTAIENKQSLIVEGCYIPFTWQQDFEPSYRDEIIYRCLVMTPDYFETHPDEITRFENIIEQRLTPMTSTDINELIEENEYNLALCKEYKLPYFLIDGDYEVAINRSIISIASSLLD